MATKKTTKEDKVEKEIATDKGQYFYAVGKRKTAVAQVRIYAVEKAKDFLINDRNLDEYFPIVRLREAVKSPIVSAGHDGKFELSVHVRGGGVNAQAEAVRLGVSRALFKFDESLRKGLKDRGFLTRDARVVERKKPGLKKARKSPQWAKR